MALAIEPLMTSPRPRLDVAELIKCGPDDVAHRLGALAEDLQLAYSSNTLRGWRADWRIWSAYCRKTAVPALPATLEAVRGFLLEAIAVGRKRATLEHYLSTITTVHRLAQLPSPMDSFEARLMWRGLKREHLILRQRQAQGLTLSAVEKITASLSGNLARDLRDAALITVAYETMYRRSELVALQIEDLDEEPDGSGRMLLRASKTDQESAGVVQYLSPSTVLRVQRWLEAASIDSGPIFRSTPRSNQADRFRTGLSDRDVARIFKRLAFGAGIDPERISGHSTRIGATQDLLAANFSPAEIMRQGRWKSEQMIVKYGEKLQAGRSAMAKLLADRES